MTRRISNLSPTFRMSSSSTIRSPHRNQTASKGGNSRQRAGHEVTTEMETDKRPRPPAQSSSSTNHRRTESSSQRTRERRKESVETAEILMRRTRSPDRPRPTDQPKHVRAISDAKPSGTSRPKVKASKPEMPQRKSLLKTPLSYRP